MNKALPVLDDAVTLSLENASKMCSVIILNGGKRQFDRLMLSTGIKTIENVVNDITSPCRMMLHSVTDERTINVLYASQSSDSNEIPNDLTSAINSLKTKKQVLMINSDLLFEDSNQPHGVEMDWLRSLIGFAEQPNAPQSLIILRVSKETFLPTQLTTHEKIKTVFIPTANIDTRLSYLTKRLTNSPLINRGGISATEIAMHIARITEGSSLDTINEIVINLESNANLNTVEDLLNQSKALQNGLLYSYWVGDALKQNIDNLKHLLEVDIKGQDAALSAIKLNIEKGYLGLKDAYHSTKGPRAVLFMAGPTGTGKTESIKRLSQIIYGSENLIRINGPEFNSAHALQRLLGAPPGYVGFDKPSELEAIIHKPNSILLIDEVEKAHHELFSTMLAILDDGQLKTGSGKLLNFSESVIVFTSNLGVYREETTIDGRVTHLPNFSYIDPYESIEKSIEFGVRDFFEKKINRPEFLGRIGQLVIYDLIRDPDGIICKWVEKMSQLLHERHKIHMTVNSDIIKRIRETYLADTRSLVLGARGLRSHMDKYITDPLSDYIMRLPNQHGSISISLLLDHNDQTTISRT